MLNTAFPAGLDSLGRDSRAFPAQAAVNQLVDALNAGSRAINMFAENAASRDLEVVR
jgi:hypothetical protein